MTPLLDMSKILFFIVLSFFFSSCSSNTIDPTGTYKLDSKTTIRNGETYGYFGDIQVKQIEDDEIVITFYVCRGAPSYNIGAFADTLSFENNQANYTCSEYDSSCVINFKFKKDGVEVLEKTNDLSFGCGFGYNVRATGTYKIISRKTPILKDPFNGKTI